MLHDRHVFITHSACGAARGTRYGPDMLGKDRHDSDASVFSARYTVCVYNRSDMTSTVACKGQI